MTHDYDALTEFEALRARLKADFPGPYTTAAPERCIDCGSLLGSTPSAFLCVVCAWHREREDPEVDETPEAPETPYQPPTGGIFSGMVNIADVAQQLTEVTEQLQAIREAIEGRFDDLTAQIQALEPPEGYTVTITPGRVASGREFLAE